MNRSLAIAVVVASVLGVAAVVTGQADKVTICHKPPGDPENAHTITVGAPAAEAHMNDHGDTNGACAGEEAQNPKDDSGSSDDDQATNPPPNQDQGPGTAASPGANSSPLWLLLLVVAAIAVGTAVVLKQRQVRPR